MNAISPQVLFEKYQSSGFLYPAKLARLSPFLELVKDNWTKAMRLGEELLWFLTFDGDDGAWATVGSWRSTLAGWNSQHAAAVGGPRASRAVLLAGAAGRVERSRGGSDLFQHNWFRPTNRFANKIFGSVVESVGPLSSWVGAREYLAIQPGQIPSDGDSAWSTSIFQEKDRDEFQLLVLQARGRVFLQGEELNAQDLELDGLDQIYHRVGLRRYRRVFLAREKHTGAVAAAAVAYRGPLGFNFSFIENRCDLIVHPSLTVSNAASASFTLLRAVAAVYDDFPPKMIPTIADERTARVLVQKGAEPIRKYSQSIWLASGYVAWYRHVERFYDRIIRAEHRHGLASDRTRAGAL
jgi:hypothetical protein